MPAVGTALAGLIASGGLGGALIRAGIGLVLNFAIGNLTAPKGPRPQRIQSEIRQSNAPRARHYGRVRTGGAVMFWDWKSEDNGRWLYKLLAISTGGIDAVEGFWLNEKSVTVDGIHVQTSPWDGPVQLYTRVGRADLQRHGGSYDVLSTAFPNNWLPVSGDTPAHRLTGVATILGRFKAVNGADLGKVYPGGEPKITALVRGSRIYDPRLGARSSATIVWSENIALQILDLLTNEEFGRMSLEDVDLATFIAAADDCDDSIPLSAGGSVPRYAGGGSYYLSEPLKDVLRRMLDACAGTLFPGLDGKIGLRVGKWRAPRYTITEDKIVGIEGGAGHGEYDQVNSLVPKYVPPQTDYQETTARPVEDASLVALIGETEPKEFELPWVQHSNQARRLTKIKLAKLNPKYRFTVQLRFWGLLLSEEESAYLDFPMLGIHNEPFWIDSFSFDPEAKDGICTVSLVHADPTTMDDGVSPNDEDPPVTPSEISNGASAPPAPVIVSLTVKKVGQDDLPQIVAQAAIDERWVLVGGYRAVGETAWTPVAVDQVSGTMQTAVLQNNQDHEIRIGYADSVLAGADVTYSVVSNIEVSVSANPPGDPVLISAAEVAGFVEIAFNPAVGANYWRTRVYSGDSFATAVVVDTTYETSEQVSVSVALQPATSYWIQSENFNQAKSAPVPAITTA